MKDSFAFAAGAVRAMETSLLTYAQILALADAEPEDRRRTLIDRGFAGFAETDDPEAALAGRMQAVYDELLPYLPDKGVLDFCVLPNDYHNLKAALKSLLRGGERRDLYRAPALCDPGLLYGALSGKDWDALPAILRDDAREGYEILTQTGNGQQLDLELDRRCLAAVLAAAEKGGALAREYARRWVLYADLRVALRLSRQEPGNALVAAALAPVPGLELPALAEATQAGEEAVKDFIRERFDAWSEEADKGYAALEKAMEDDLTRLLQQAKSLACGADVPVAYYLAREGELKNVRILTAGAKAGRNGAALRERMRETYA